MKRRYVVAPQAARDLVQIWRYVRNESSYETADCVESVIRSKRCGVQWYAAQIAKRVSMAMYHQ